MCCQINQWAKFIWVSGNNTRGFLLNLEGFGTTGITGMSGVTDANFVTDKNDVTSNAPQVT